MVAQLTQILRVSRILLQCFDMRPCMQGIFGTYGDT